MGYTHISLSGFKPSKCHRIVLKQYEEDPTGAKGTDSEEDRQGLKERGKQSVDLVIDQGWPHRVTVLY